MTCGKAFYSLTKHWKRYKLNLGDGRTVEALGFGIVRLNLYLYRMNSKRATLCYCMLYVWKLKCNLFSVRAAASEGNVVTFDKTSCKIYNMCRKPVVYEAAVQGV